MARSLLSVANRSLFVRRRLFAGTEPQSPRTAIGRDPGLSRRNRINPAGASTLGEGVNSGTPDFSVGGRGSNMVSRDDTAGMHQLMACWLRDEVERLLGIGADSATSPVDRGKAHRAVLHLLCILAVFFR